MAILPEDARSNSETSLARRCCDGTVSCGCGVGPGVRFRGVGGGPATGVRGGGQGRPGAERGGTRTDQDRGVFRAPDRGTSARTEGKRLTVGENVREAGR